MKKTNKNKIEVNGKSITFRFNDKRMLFECNYGYVDLQGIRQSRIIRGGSVQELQEKVAHAMKILDIMNIASPTISFDTFFQFYIRNIAPNRIRASSIKMNCADWKIIPPNIKNSSLCNLTSLQLQCMYADIKDKYSRNSIKFLHSLIDKLLNLAVEFKLLRENPNKKCKVPGFVNGEKHYIDLVTLAKFLKFLKEKHLNIYRPVLLLAFSGCRRGEAIGLRKKCVDIQNNTITINAQITLSGFTEQLKTASSYRVIKLPEWVIKEITQYEDNDTEFVFINKNTQKPFSSNYFAKKFSYAAKSFGFNKFSPKDLRSSFVKNAVLNNVSLKVVQNILGHAKLSTTADIYGELTSEDTFWVADVLAKAYEQKNTSS